MTIKKRNYIETNKRFFNVNRKKVFFKKREIKCEINLIDIKKKRNEKYFLKTKLLPMKI